ncbi:MAG: hypothetical protein ACO2Z9_02715 [Crocinitomicaceae bacterium]
MALTVKVYLLNDDFSQEYADMHNDGNESELNRHYEWQDELEVTSDVKKIEVVKNGTYTLAGELADGRQFSYDVPKMRLFSVQSNDAMDLLIGCSESLLSDYKVQDNELLEIFLKDYEPLSNPVPGVYIAAQEFPKDLID